VLESRVSLKSLCSSRKSSLKSLRASRKSVASRAVERGVRGVSYPGPRGNGGAP